MTSPLPLPDPSDEGLALRGDLAGLYERYAWRLLALLKNTLNVPEECLEDLHHDVWLKVGPALSAKPFKGHFRGWLFHIARNVVIDWRRRQRGAVPLPERLVDRNNPAPLAEVFREEEQALLGRCLKCLSEAERSVFRLRLAGADHPEICRQLGISVKVAYGLFDEAKRKLKECVKKADT